MERIGSGWLASLLILALACGSVSGPPPLDPGEPRPYEPDPAVETDVRIPEVYELANVTLAITDYGRNDRWSVLKHGGYYARVMEQFGPYSDHELIGSIGPLVEASYSGYYGFRENAFSYRFSADGLEHAGEYHDVWRSPDLFADRLELVEDFAAVTGFRDFYEREGDTYRRQIERYRTLVDLPGMAGWLHDRFPDQRVDRYTVVFSPLIRGSHSTRNFERDGVREAVMFIAGPELPLGDLDAAVVAGLHERVVFTEIDHNYVNPTTDDFLSDVNRVFADWRAWNTGDSYDSPYRTFNEYMTWAVFTLYAADAYPPEVFREVAARSGRQMENARGFVHFRAFERELLRLYRERTDVTIRELYGPILEWAGRQEVAAPDRES